MGVIIWNILWFSLWIKFSFKLHFQIPDLHYSIVQEFVPSPESSRSFPSPQTSLNPSPAPPSPRSSGIDILSSPVSMTRSHLVPRALSLEHQYLHCDSAPTSSGAKPIRDRFYLERCRKDSHQIIIFGPLRSGYEIGRASCRERV